MKKFLGMTLIVTHNNQPQFYTENIIYSFASLELEILAAYNPTSANLTLVCSDSSAGTLAATPTSKSAVASANNAFSKLASNRNNSQELINYCLDYNLYLLLTIVKILP